MTTATRSGSTRRATAVIAIALLGALVHPAAADAMTRAAHVQVAKVSGNWVSSEPLTITQTRSLGAAAVLAATGTSHWTGDLRGPTAFTLKAIADPTGALHGTINETFRGAVAGIGTGELTFAEVFRSAPDGQLTLEAVIVSGTGALGTVRGTLRFVGVTDATGVGGGSYEGTVVWVDAQ